MVAAVSGPRALHTYDTRLATRAGGPTSTADMCSPERRIIDVPVLSRTIERFHVRLIERCADDSAAVRPNESAGAELGATVVPRNGGRDVSDAAAVVYICQLAVAARAEIA